MSNVNAVSFTILVVAFVLVTLVGFAAARWRRAESLLHLDEWGLGGRGFGTFVSWFLLGGDLYTAYTFIAVPALVYGVGAAGFFAVPYTIMVFPIVFVFAPRLWSVCREHGYVTPADFVRGRYGSRGLALAVAATGILATMPYIALQLVGIQAVLTVMGVGVSSNSFLKDLPLLIAFVVLAAYTFVSGLRAPALTAFIKDALVYVADHRGGPVHPDPAGRLVAHLRRRVDPPGLDQPQDRQAVRRAGHPARRGVGLRHAGPRVGAGPVHVPARHHRGAGHQAARRDPPEHGHPARLLAGARPGRAARATWRWPTPP